MRDWSSIDKKQTDLVGNFQGKFKKLEEDFLSGNFVEPGTEKKKLGLAYDSLATEKDFYFNSKTLYTPAVRRLMNQKEAG